MGDLVLGLVEMLGGIVRRGLSTSILGRRVAVASADARLRIAARTCSGFVVYVFSWFVAVVVVV